MSFNLSEIGVVLLVAFLVIKPDRLPEMALAVGRLIKRAKKIMTTLSQDIELPLGKYSYQDAKEKHESKSDHSISD